jgi:ribosomal protein L30
MAKLQITYVKSAIGYSKVQKDTVRSLGLRKLNSTVVHDDTPAIRGMAFTVRHLVQVAELSDAEAERLAPAATASPAAPAKPAARATATLVPAAAAPSAAKSHRQDDLEAIEGIGPKIAGVLRDAGITTFAQLAATDVSALSEILQGASIRLADPATWPEQAQLAADEKWDEFKALQDSLKGGRRE